MYPTWTVQRIACKHVRRGLPLSAPRRCRPDGRTTDGSMERHRRRRRRSRRRVLANVSIIKHCPDVAGQRVICACPYSQLDDPCYAAQRPSVNANISGRPTAIGLYDMNDGDDASSISASSLTATCSHSSATLKLRELCRGFMYNCCVQHAAIIAHETTALHRRYGKCTSSCLQWHST